MQNIRLIVGLGNPGAEYDKTRHNVGFDFIDRLAEKTGASLSNQTKFFCHLGQANVSPYAVKLSKPTTYMNLSGQAVLAICQFHKIEIDEILVVHDELDLPPGIIKLKKGGGHGGHNGLRNIIERFGGKKDFHRLRIGIGHPGHKSRVTGHVLGKPPADEKAAIDSAIDEAVRCTEILLKEDLKQAQNRLHSHKA